MLEVYADSMCSLYAIDSTKLIFPLFINSFSILLPSNSYQTASNRRLPLNPGQKLQRRAGSIEFCRQRILILSLMYYLNVKIFEEYNFSSNTHSYFESAHYERSTQIFVIQGRSQKKNKWGQIFSQAEAIDVKT